MNRLQIVACMGLLAVQGAVSARQLPEGVRMFLYSNDTTVYSICDQTMTMPGTLFSAKQLRGAGQDSMDKPLRLEKSYRSSQNVFMVDREGKKFLIDAGFGNAKSQLMPMLKKLGVPPDEISAVFITHIHPDHVGGLADANGAAAFPNAKLYIGRTEYVEWQGDEGRLALAKYLKPYKERMELLEYGKTFMPYDIKPLLYKGHTPGHTVYELPMKQNKPSVFFVGDIVHAAELQLYHPEYCARFDKWPVNAIGSRQQLMRDAKIWFGAHIPFPGLVEIQRKKDADGKEAFSFHFVGTADAAK